jgi:hypothetical protein
MKNFILRILSLVVSVLLGFSAAAQTVVWESEIIRQQGGTPPADKWVAYTSNTGSVTFLQGPGSSPLGCGSVQLSTPTADSWAWLYNYDYIGTRLADITAFFYLTYKTAGNPIHLPALNLEIDFNGPAAAGGNAILVYEPYYNTPPGTIQNDVWQTWDAFDKGTGIWWSDQPINGVCALDCFVSWKEILAQNPEAIITGGFGLNEGPGNPGLTGAVDGLGIGVKGTTTIYDFEAAPPATYYSDADGDGYGDANNAVEVCLATPPQGYVANNYDCDDHDGQKKVLVCHKGISFCIKEKDLQAHIHLGGQPGPCTTALVVDISSLQIPLTEILHAFAYPNPTQGAINVKLPAIISSQAEILILNAGGSIVERRRTAAAGQVESFDLSRHGTGLFFIKVMTADRVEHLKVLVQ